MDKTYNHSGEPALYKAWEDSQAFQPMPSGQRAQKNFCVIMPPPNANGNLHIGHALFVTLEDILVRFHRLLGEATMWVPGADHAGILTQVVYERELEKTGQTRFELGREHFVANLYEFTLKHRGRMEDQLRRLGASCDWSQKAFTLEPRFDAPINATFKKLYNDKLMYRGERLVNWCSRCQTALSDLEVKHETQAATLWHIAYLTTDGKNKIVVATTRPETMLGDTAVAVHPDDPRWQKLIGQQVILPLLKRAIPVVTDPAVDITFGTGAVKVTPAHDAFDLALAGRHHLGALQVIGFDGRMTKLAGPYEGQLFTEARQTILTDLKNQDLIVKEETFENNLGACERCGTVIEPQISLQWFVRTKPLAQVAKDAVAQKRVVFTPPRFTKEFARWLDNIEDWCVSRQLWWGHQLPVWYCGSGPLSPLQKALNRLPEVPGCGEVIISVETPEACPKCKSSQLVRDPDTLDTWFSSGQWPFNVLGRDPFDDGDHNPPEYKRFYPTSVMETGYDILFMWVARMLMLGLYVTGEVPFKTVYLHGLVRDSAGRKMSKSKGNVVDPLSVVEKIGADSLRFALVHGTTPGNDLKFSPQLATAGRNFSNKLWNMGRFLKTHPADLSALPKPESYIDAWLVFYVNKTIDSVTKDLLALAPGRALETLYNFVWNEFADWNLEVAKIRSHDRAFGYAHWAFRNLLVLLHPFMPFVTEALWQELYSHTDHPLLITATWPKAEVVADLEPKALAFEQFKQLVTAARGLKQLAQLPQNEAADFALAPSQQFAAVVDQEQKIFLPLARAKTLKVETQTDRLAKGLKSVGDYGILVLQTAQGQATALKKRLTGQRAETAKRLKAKAALLKKKDFKAKAPAEVIKKIETEITDIEKLVETLNNALAGL